MFSRVDVSTADLQQIETQAEATIEAECLNSVLGVTSVDGAYLDAQVCLRIYQGTVSLDMAFSY